MVVTIGVGSRSPMGLSITTGVAGAARSERAGIDATFRRSRSSFSALVNYVSADERGCSLIVAPFLDSRILPAHLG